jgi:hypothetical protein
MANNDNVHMRRPTPARPTDIDDPRRVWPAGLDVRSNAPGRYHAARPSALGRVRCHRPDPETDGLVEVTECCDPAVGGAAVS